MKYTVKKEIIKSIKILALALMIGVGTTFAIGAWSEATTTPAGENTDSPIQTSTSIQSKSGNLKIQNDIGTGAVSTDILSVFGTSYFGDDVLVGDAEFDTPSVDAHVTGKVGVNRDSDFAVELPAVELHVEGTARFSDLSSVENVGLTYPAGLCVTTDGSLTVCPVAAIPVVTPSISAPTVTNQVHQSLTDGDLCDADVSLTGTATSGSSPYTYSWRVKNNTPTPNVEINYIEMADYQWKNVGTAPTTNFHVQVRNPGDSWTAELTATDIYSTVGVTTSTFGVWNLLGCN